jgi:tetratricopeptide (TPR) repeat protein
MKLPVRTESQTRAELQAPKESRASAFIAIVVPLLVALIYVGPFSRSRARPVSSSPTLTAEESHQLWEQCNSLFRQGKYQEALPGVLRLHETYPSNHIYLEMGAEIYDRLGRYPQEVEFWEMYFDRAPNPVTACPQIGQAYSKLGKEKEAISALERCLSRDPDNSDSIFFLAHALEQSGQTRRAADLYQRGLKIAPDYADLQVGLARVWLRQGNVEGATRMIEKALQQSPNNVDALLVAGMLYTSEHDLPRAKKYLQQGAARADGYLDFHFALARIAEEEKDFPEAIRQYERILKDRPDDESVRSKRDALMGRQ